MDVCHLAHEDARGAVAWLGEVDRSAVREQGYCLLRPGPDERVGVLEPGDPDLELLERDGSRLEIVREDSEQLGAAGDRVGERARVVEARREREAAVQRDEAVGRLEADDAAAGGRDPDRAARVGSEGRVGEPRRERRRRAAAGAARDPVAPERIRDGAEVRVDRRDPVGELVQVGFADVDPARRLGAAHGLRAYRRHVVGEQDGAVGRDQPGRVEQILDREPPPFGDLVRSRRSSEEDPVSRSHGPVTGLTGSRSKRHDDHAAGAGLCPAGGTQRKKRSLSRTSAGTLGAANS